MHFESNAPSEHVLIHKLQQILHKNCVQYIDNSTQESPRRRLSVTVTVTVTEQQDGIAHGGLGEKYFK